MSTLDECVKRIEKLEAEMLEVKTTLAESMTPTPLGPPIPDVLTEETVEETVEETPVEVTPVEGESTEEIGEEEVGPASEVLSHET